MQRKGTLLALVVLLSLSTPAWAFNYKFWEYIFPPKKEVLTPLQEIRRLDRTKLAEDLKQADQYLANMADKMDKVNQDVKMLNLEGSEILNTIKDIIDSSSDADSTPKDKKTKKVADSDSKDAKSETSKKGSRRLQDITFEQAVKERELADAALRFLNDLLVKQAGQTHPSREGHSGETQNGSPQSRLLEQVDALADMFGVSDDNSHAGAAASIPNPSHLERSQYDQETVDNWSRYFGDSQEVEKLIDVLLRKSNGVREAGSSILDVLKHFPPKWD